MSFKTNMKNILDKLNFSVGSNEKALRIVHLDQNHGTNVKTIRRKESSAINETIKSTSCTDSALTSEVNTVLFTSTADCLPMLFFEPDHQVIAIAHAGWRGVMGKIFLKTILSMISTKHCNLKQIRVGIGPSIGKCCQILRDPDFLDDFPEWDKFKYVDEQGRIHMDLRGFTLHELVSCGIKASNIELADHCTCHMQDLYFSHRRKDIGQQISFICIRKG